MASVRSISLSRKSFIWCTLREARHLRDGQGRSWGEGRRARYFLPFVDCARTALNRSGMATVFDLLAIQVGIEPPGWVDRL